MVRLAYFFVHTGKALPAHMVEAPTMNNNILSTKALVSPTIEATMSAKKKED